MDDQEINKQIAELVFNHNVILNTNKNTSYYTLGDPDWYDDHGQLLLLNPLPDYVNDISLAMEIINFLQPVCDFQSYSNKWLVKLSVRQGTSDKIVSAFSKTLEKAICLAVLKAIQNE